MTPDTSMGSAMTVITFTESRPNDILANLHQSAVSDREYLFASHDASDQDLILVAWYQDRAIGYIATTDQRDEGLLVWEHVVVPEFRGQGVGKRLLLEAAKRTSPTSPIIIDPMGELAIDRVVDYYAALGFPSKPSGKQISAIAQVVVDALSEQREDETTLAAVLSRKEPSAVTVAPDAPITQALSLMNNLRIGAIVASTDGSRVEGILSERDILVGVDTHGAAFLERKVRDCITADVITVTSTDLISDAMATMTSRRIRHLPVTETGRLVGIISVGDLLLFRLQELDTARSDLPRRQQETPHS